MDDHDLPSGKLFVLPQAPDAIELRHLRVFVAVAEELNFGRAAARLYLSQPALSRQVRTLERLVGCDLLHRTTHRVQLTVAGEALLDRARKLLGDLDDAVTVTRSVGDELTSRISGYWSFLDDLGMNGAQVQEWRDGFETLHARFAPPPEVDIRPVNAGGVPSLLLTPGSKPATILHLHGGGFVMGSAFGYRPLAGALAVAADTGVLLPEYRLAPEHPFPAAVEDAMRSYLWLLDSGTDPQRVSLTGDSVGAHLVMSLVISLKQRELPLPGRMVLLSPGVDLDRKSLRHRPESASVAVSVEQLRRLVDLYLDGHPTDDPVVNPLTADLAGLPPMLIQGGADDPVVDDAHRLATHACGYGVEVQLDLYPIDAHLFHIFWSFLPEAAKAISDAGHYIRQAKPATGTRRIA